MRSGRITKSSRGGYLLTGLGGDYPGGVVARVDDALNVQWVKWYIDPDVMVGAELHAPVETPEGYLLYGVSNRFNNIPEPVIIYHISEEGEVLWLNYYGDPQVTDWGWWGLSVRENGTIIFGISSAGKGPTILKIDMNGDVLESWHAGLDSEIGILRGIHVTDEEDYIIFSHKEVGYNEDNEPLYHPTLSKVTLDYNIDWSFQFGTAYNLVGMLKNWIWDIQPTSDGSFICTGQTRAYNPSREAGWLFKFTPQGDSIWSHVITPPAPLDDIQQTWLGGVAELPGGEAYVAGGRSVVLGQGHFWVVRVDRHGCLEDYCPELYVSTEEALKEETVELIIMPNPNSGYFHLDWGKEPHPQQQLSMMAYTANGQLVWQQSVYPTEAIDLSFLPKGIYFMHLRNKEREWRMKWIRQ